MRWNLLLLQVLLLFLTWHVEAFAELLLPPSTSWQWEDVSSCHSNASIVIEEALSSATSPLSIAAFRELRELASAGACEKHTAPKGLPHFSLDLLVRAPSDYVIEKGGALFYSTGTDAVERVIDSGDDESVSPAASPPHITGEQEVTINGYEEGGDGTTYLKVSISGLHGFLDAVTAITTLSESSSAFPSMHPIGRLLSESLSSSMTTTPAIHKMTIRQLCCCGSTLGICNTCCLDCCSGCAECNCVEYSKCGSACCGNLIYTPNSVEQCCNGHTYDPETSYCC